jgi:hypothetical protein
LSATSKAEMRLPISFELPPVLLGVGVGGVNSDAASGKISRICFKEASRNFKSTFQDIEGAKKNKKPLAHIQKVLSL